MEASLPAFYRTSDPIDNLLVRVSIRKKTSVHDPAGELALRTQAALSLAPARSDSAQGTVALTSTGLFDARAGAGQAGTSAAKVFEFSWQQKVYGPRELLRYANAIADKRAGRKPTGVDLSSPIEVEYMNDVERRLDAGEPLFEAPPDGIILYTVTDREGAGSVGDGSRAIVEGPTMAAGLLPGLRGLTGSNLPGLFGEQWARLLGGQPGAAAAGAGGAWGAGTAGAGAAGALPGAALPGVAGPGAITGPAGRPGPGQAPAGAQAPGIAGAVSSPLADARGVFAHAFKEHPYSTMYVVAAVGLDREGFRQRRLDTACYEVPLMAIRAHTPSPGSNGASGGSSLVEMRPGFSDFVPYDRASIIALTRTISGEAPTNGLAAAAALESSDSVLGQGRYGGTMRLRQLHAAGGGGAAGGAATATGTSGAGYVGGPSGSATPGGFRASSRGPSTPSRPGGSTATAAAPQPGSSPPPAAPIDYDREGSVLAYSLECHSFTSPLDGCAYEYSVVNPDEDLAAILGKVTGGAAGTGGGAAGGAGIAGAGGTSGYSRWAGRRGRGASTADLDGGLDADDLQPWATGDMAGDGVYLSNASAGRRAAIGNYDSSAGILQEELRAIERATNRVPSEFHSGLPMTTLGALWARAQAKSQAQGQGQGQGQGQDGATGTAALVPFSSTGPQLQTGQGQAPGQPSHQQIPSLPPQLARTLVPALHPGSFKLVSHLEIVAAARFSVGSGLLGTAGASGLAGALLPLFGLIGGQAGVYISYELVLPRGSGWRVLPPSDVPHSSLGTGSGGPRSPGGSGGERMSLFTAMEKGLVGPRAHGGAGGRAGLGGGGDGLAGGLKPGPMLASPGSTGVPGGSPARDGPYGAHGPHGYGSPGYDGSSADGYGGRSARARRRGRHGHHGHGPDGYHPNDPWSAAAAASGPGWAGADEDSDDDEGRGLLADGSDSSSGGYGSTDDDGEDAGRVPYAWQEHEGACSGTGAADGGAGKGASGLRNRFTGATGSMQGGNTDTGAGSGTSTAQVHHAHSSQRRESRRWLRSTHVRGITQVAGFRQRPWTFGRPSASRPTGVFAARGGAASGLPGGDGGLTGGAALGPFSGGFGPGSAAGKGGSLGPGGHPFGFGSGGGASGSSGSGAGATGGAASAGYQRIDGKWTARGSIRGNARGDGSGSVSLISGLSTDSGPSGCVDSGSSGLTSGTGPAAFESIQLPAEDIVPVAHIGHPIALNLLCDTGACLSPSGPSPPQLFLTVCSRDGWGRHRVEGYAWADVPITAGSRDLVLKAWRSIPNGEDPTALEQASTDFFLGGSGSLTDVTSTRVPSTWRDHTAGRHGLARARHRAAGLYAGISSVPLPGSGPVPGDGPSSSPSSSASGQLPSGPVASLNRLGWTTVTAGEVGLRVHTIVQRYPPAPRPDEDEAGPTGAAGRAGGGGALGTRLSSRAGLTAGMLGRASLGLASGVGIAALAGATGGLAGLSGRTPEQIIAETQAISRRVRELGIGSSVGPGAGSGGATGATGRSSSITAARRAGSSGPSGASDSKTDGLGATSPSRGLVRAASEEGGAGAGPAAGSRGSSSGRPPVGIRDGPSGLSGTLVSDSAHATYRDALLSPGSGQPGGVPSPGSNASP